MSAFRREHLDDLAKSELNDLQFKQILKEFNLSWRGYRRVRKGVKKRLRRHMQSLGCRSVDGYLEILKAQDAAHQECRRRLTVAISRFFRDRAVWKRLAHDMLPPLIAASRHHPAFRIWSAGCACGEEVYSFQIIWQHLQASGIALPELRILATDMNLDCLVKAQTGIYPQSSLKHVSCEDRNAFFIPLPKGKRFQVKSMLSRGIIWQRHDLLGNPPQRGFHIVFLRNNLLTYHRDPEASAALRRIANTLYPHCSLVIGRHEMLPPELHPSFIQPFPSLPIFRKA